MNIVQTAAGALAVLLTALGSTPSLVCRLFSNNISVGLATTLGGLTQASFTGYAAVSPTWTTPTLSGTTALTAPTPTNVDFTYSGASTTTVYGFYLTDAGNTALFGATTFAAPFVFSTIVTVLSVFPVYTQKSEFSTS